MHAEVTYWPFAIHYFLLNETTSLWLASNANGIWAVEECFCFLAFARVWPCSSPNVMSSCTTSVSWQNLAGSLVAREKTICFVLCVSMPSSTVRPTAHLPMLASNIGRKTEISKTACVLKSGREPQWSSSMTGFSPLLRRVVLFTVTRPPWLREDEGAGCIFVQLRWSSHTIPTMSCVNGRDQTSTAH